MTRVVVPAVIVVAVVGWWLWRWRRDGDWRLGPILVVIPLLLFTGNEARWAYTEARFTEAVSGIIPAHRGSAFGCERMMRNFFSSNGYAGHVQFDSAGVPARSAFLSMNTCSRLTAFRRHPEHADLAEIVAVNTLAHEAGHLSGERDEAATECIALRHWDDVMGRLGASREDAERYRARFLREVYPQLPSEYQGGCPELTDAAP